MDRFFLPPLSTVAASLYCLVPRPTHLHTEWMVCGKKGRVGEKKKMNEREKEERKKKTLSNYKQNVVNSHLSIFEIGYQFTVHSAPQ